MAYRLNRTGLEVEQLLEKIDDLREVTTMKSGTMTALDKRKLDQLEQDEQLSIEDIDDVLIL